MAPVGQVVVGKELQVELVEFKRHRKLQVNLQVTTTTTTNSLTETAGKTRVTTTINWVQIAAATLFG